MKVLFAVNNDEISNEVIKRYQKNYKEILTYKNVYYFNAILKELQRDKTYDRVVISEDLEPFANNNYDTIDKFLFEKLDNISDEATNESGFGTDIILICADRRTKSDEMLNKLFGIGIYSAIIGEDRSIDRVCKLINRPRTKKEAKQYYKIESDSINYQVESENSVSETEVQNILAHYERLGKNEDKYVASFDSIASQYTDTQLKIIVKYLPMHVKAVLETKSPKYQQLVSFNPNENSNSVLSNKATTTYGKMKKKLKSTSLPENKLDKIEMSKPVVIPSGVSKTHVTKLIEENEEPIEEFQEQDTFNVKDEFDFEDLNNFMEDVQDTQENNIQNSIQETEPKRGRGRPKKNTETNQEEIAQPKRGRGRPKKNTETENQGNELNTSIEDTIDLFELGNDLEKNVSTEPDTNNSEQEENIDLFDLYEENNNDVNYEEVEDNTFKSNSLESLDEFNAQYTENNNEDFEDVQQPINIEEGIVETQYKPVESTSNVLISKDKKIVSFVGTTKNGTSFVVNNTAHMLSSMGINTAILDMTKSRNAYYMYTDSKEKLIEIAKNSISNLRIGVAEGLKIDKNLTLYTTVPDDDSDYSDVDSIISTLLNNYSVVLIDCDFNTDIRYFEASQEIYLVQSMDVLTMQPLTAFLRNLQSKGVLKEEKIKVVINKAVNLKSVSIKTLIGGISTYSDPSLTIMKTLFNKDTVHYSVIPFEVQNYIKYLDAVINCNVSLNGYTKPLITALKELANMIYPLINNQTYSYMENGYQNGLSNNMNSTLDKMKKKYN